MLHPVPEDRAKQQAMHEILRVLKPGRRLLILDVTRPENCHILGLASLIVGHGMLAHKLEESAPLLERAGFTAIESGPTQYSFLRILSINRGRQAPPPPAPPQNRGGETFKIRFFRPSSGEKTAKKVLPRLGAGGRGVGKNGLPRVIEMILFCVI